MHLALPPRHTRLLFLALGVLLASGASAQPISVVTHEDTPVASLSREDVADLFLGKRKLAIAGRVLTPIDIGDETLREAFYQAVAEMSAVRVNAYWARMVFSAQGRPPRKLPLSEARTLVQAQPGLITYVPAGGNGEFKIVLRLP